MSSIRFIQIVLLLVVLGGCGKKETEDQTTQESEPEAEAQIPDTDIYLATVGIDDGQVTFGSILNLTDRPGYDNQPHFLPDGSGLLFTSIRDGKQADIYRLEYRGMKAVQVTDTPESEYSPTYLSGGGFSTVRVEEDGTQRLWRIGDGGDGAEVILSDVKGVGYHSWLDDTKLALFIVGDDEKDVPHSLHIADTMTGKSQKVLDNPGRALHPIPNDGGLSFIDKSDPKNWWIKRLDLNTLESTNLVKTLDGSEDFTWTPDGGIIMAEKQDLYYWPGSGPWKKVISLKGQVAGPITRVHINADGSRLALVAQTEQDGP
ncbi:MAG: hypothetical protein AAF438_12925 [Pseudomonadota bacterium]